MANADSTYEVQTEYWGPQTIEAADDKWREMSAPYVSKFDIDLAPIEVEERHDFVSPMQHVDVGGSMAHGSYSATLFDVGVGYPGYSLGDYTIYQSPHYSLSDGLSLDSSCSIAPSAKVEELSKLVPTSVTNPDIPPPEVPKTSKTRVSRRTRLRRREPARYRCSDEGCNRSFSRLFDSQRHHRETHLDERTWVCNDNADNVRSIGLNGCRVEKGGCGKKFKRRSHLRAHLNVAGQYKRAGTFDDSFAPSTPQPIPQPSSEWDGSFTNEGIYSVQELKSSSS